MTTTNLSKRKLIRQKVGELPLIQSIADQMELGKILDEFIPKHSREEVAPGDVLMLIILNLTIGKAPLYELDNWFRSLDLRGLGYSRLESTNFTDDRFARALDRLFDVDRASLMTTIVVKAIKAFKIDCSHLHNDSTTIKAYGDYPEKTATGFELKKGNSKDHRPDLKQLLFSLSVSADGTVPIHYKCYPGNRGDDTTHIETWNTLRDITQRSDFLYVADCKLCSDKQLSHIVEQGGRVVTVMPNSWGEAAIFKDSLRQQMKPKKEILRKVVGETGRTNYFYAFEGEYLTNKRGYRIHWLYSTEEAERERAIRDERLQKVEDELRNLRPKLNQRKLKTEQAILDKCTKIIQERRVEGLIQIKIDQTSEHFTIKKGPGRPGRDTKVEIGTRAIYSLSWSRDLDAIKAEQNIDGVFPILCTDTKMSPRDALVAHKYQPRLEKRFSQFKSVHNAAPLLFKNLERIEATMFLFFIALMIQALIERKVRAEMKIRTLEALELYPEGRETCHPTTSKIFGIFSDVSRYMITAGGGSTEEHIDELTNTQIIILTLLGLSVDQYWQRPTPCCASSSIELPSRDL